jgi:phage terminase large subunit-like protein
MKTPMTLTSSAAKPATYPTWIYDGSTIDDPFGYGERAVNFIRNLRHPKSKGPFRLDPWQERIVRRIYGPRHPDETRIVKTVFLMVGRGARKTSLGAVLTLLHLIGPEKVAGGQIVCAAADQKQATIAFDESASILRQDRRLNGLAKISDHFKRMKHGNGTKLEAVSADGATSHGRTPTFVLADEIHVWRNRSLHEALRTGLVKTAGSLQVITTTAGRGQTNIGFEAYDYARKIAIGEIDDPATLPIIFECAPDCDWQDETQWHLANPGLQYGYPDIAGLRQLAREAQNRPGERESFRQLNLNIWLDGLADPWLEMPIYDEGGIVPIDYEGRAGEAAWLGVDLASTGDLTAVVAALRDPDGGFSLIPYVFAPEASLRRRQDRGEAPYSTWASDGHLIATPGEVTDWGVVEDKIRELCAHFDVKEIAFDPWSAQQMMTSLDEDGFPVVEHRQGFVSMTAPMKAFERAVLSRKVRHGGHPVLRWNVSNVVADRDPADNLKPNKSKSKEKIDAAVAAIMALGRAEIGETNTSIYADATRRPHGLLSL